MEWSGAVEWSVFLELFFGDNLPFCDSSGKFE